jgi:hypothetical protein
MAIVAVSIGLSDKVPTGHKVLLVDIYTVVANLEVVNVLIYPRSPVAGSP